MQPRTRFAPSPTGSLHLGGARTAIFNWLFARHGKGEFVLRIEDTDQARSTQESLDEILRGMEWLGLDWDEGPYKQSERLEEYRKYADQLVQEGKAYKCYVSPEELTEKRKEAEAGGGVFRYDRRWAKENEGPDNPYVIRLLTPDTGLVEVSDMLRGTVNFEATEIEDFVLLKRDGFPTYNFAVVVDDATMNITHIIRGDDHLINTPRQVLIYKALGFDLPQMAHVSMIHGEDKTKLSKRHGATSITEYKEMGYLPEALLNYLTRLGWSYGDEEIFSADDLIDKFTLDNVGKSPAVFNPEKLSWLNGWWIRNKDSKELADIIMPILEQKELGIETDTKLIKIIEELKQRAKTLHDITGNIDYFYTDPKSFDEKADHKFLKPEFVPVFSDLIQQLDELAEIDTDNVRGVFEDLMTAHDLKMGKIAQPVRVALTGGTVSPGIFEVIDILGKDTVLRRLGNAIAHIKSK